MSHSTRILIVDDDPRVLLIMSAALERMNDGPDVETAANGREALQIVEQAPIDLLITDLRMPGMDGVELTEAVQKLVSGVVVIWITAHGCQNLEADRERLDVFRCMDKPIRIDQIRQAVKTAMEKAQH